MPAATRLRVPPPLLCNPHHDLIAQCNDCTLQSLHLAITSLRSTRQLPNKSKSWHTPPAGPGRGEQRSTPPRTPCSSPTFPSSPPPARARRILFSYPGVNQEKPPTRTDSTMQSLHSAITPPAPPAPRQLSNFPTSRKADKSKSRQVEKPTSRKVGKLAHTTSRAGQGRTEHHRVLRLNVPPCIRHHLILCARRLPISATLYLISPPLLPPGRPNAAKPPTLLPAALLFLLRPACHPYPRVDHQQQQGEHSPVPVTRPNVPLPAVPPPALRPPSTNPQHQPPLALAAFSYPAEPLPCPLRPIPPTFQLPDKSKSWQVGTHHQPPRTAEPPVTFTVHHTPSRRPLVLPRGKPNAAKRPTTLHPPPAAGEPPPYRSGSSHPASAHPCPPPPALRPPSTNPQHQPPLALAAFTLQLARCRNVVSSSHHPPAAGCRGSTPPTRSHPARTINPCRLPPARARLLISPRRAPAWLRNVHTSSHPPLASLPALPGGKPKNRPPAEPRTRGTPAKPRSTSSRGAAPPPPSAANPPPCIRYPAPAEPARRIVPVHPAPCAHRLTPPVDLTRLNPPPCTRGTRPPPYPAPLTPDLACTLLPLLRPALATYALH